MFIEARPFSAGPDDITMINVDYIDMIRTRENGACEIFTGSRMFIGTDKIVRLISTLSSKKIYFIRLHYAWDKSEFFVRKNKIKSITWDKSGDHASLILDGTKEIIKTLESYLEIKKLLEV
jgi:hypothetical protein